MSSSSDPSDGAEDSLLIVSDDCLGPCVGGIPWETQTTRNARFQSAAAGVRFSIGYTRSLYRERDRLTKEQERLTNAQERLTKAQGKNNNALAFNLVQINQAEEERRSAARAFKNVHSTMTPDATSQDVTGLLSLSFPDLTTACAIGPLSKPDGPLYEELADIEPVTDTPVCIYAGPSTSTARFDRNNNANTIRESSTASAYRLVSSTSGPVVRSNGMIIPALLPLEHLVKTEAFNTGYNNSRPTMPSGKQRRWEIKPIKLKLKRSVRKRKAVMPGSKKEFWEAFDNTVRRKQTVLSKRTASMPLPTAAGDSYSNLLATII
jgi:hypothetical protein